MHIYICPECGAHLDPGEHCDCQDEKYQKKQIYEDWLRKKTVTEKNGQLRLVV